MPLLVRGGGGGKNTKDATAVPGDVRSGKTFYGADGKQTGIWTPKVTDYTGDATAIPSDVAKGQIFYNNDGKQVGTGFPYFWKNLKSMDIILPVVSSIKQTIPGFSSDYNKSILNININYPDNTYHSSFGKFILSYDFTNKKIIFAIDERLNRVDFIEPLYRHNLTDAFGFTFMYDQSPDYLFYHRKKDGQLYIDTINSRANKKKITIYFEEG